MKKEIRKSCTLFGASLCLLPFAFCFFNFKASATLANAWHIPDNAGDLGLNMRNPEFEVGTNAAVTVYSGEQKYNNAFGGTGVVRKARWAGTPS